jgi:hypothetical protein
MTVEFGPFKMQATTQDLPSDCFAGRVPPKPLTESD